MKPPFALLALALLTPACDRVAPGAFDADDFDVGDEPDAEPGDAADADADADAPEAACEATEVRLVTDEGSNAGAVTITTTDAGLRVDLAANGRWRLTAVEAFAGVGAPPNDGQALTPERFPVTADLDPARAYGFTIPFEQVQGGLCGDALVVAVHAEVVDERDGELAEPQIAWAEGPDGVDPGWGSELEIELCCE
jgi:hypothetical protein